MESLQVQLPNDLQEATKAMIGDALNKAIKDAQNKNSLVDYRMKLATQLVVNKKRHSA